MAELGGTVEYIYWSTRRVSRFLEDNNLVIQPATTTITSPSFGWLPTFSRSRIDANGSRPRDARTVEKSLGRSAVTNFDAPTPIKWAKSTGTVVFGEFLTIPFKFDRKPAVMLAVGDYSRNDKGSVAICLFGSMDNFLEFIQESGPGTESGWTSSSSKAVYNLIKSHGNQLDDPYYKPQDMALEALKIAEEQGIYKAIDQCSLGIDKPWRRGYTYGDVHEAQWLAQIYLDVDLEEAGVGRVRGYRRVLVGAPLWIRTPDLQSVSLYANPSDLELQARETVEKTPRSTERRLKAAAAKPDNTSLPDYQIPSTEIDIDHSLTPGLHTITMPDNVFRALKGSFIQGTAEWAISQATKDHEGPRISHLGDPFGTVFSWIWMRDRGQAILMLADYLAVLRRHHPLAGSIDPPIRLDEILEALYLALPWNFDEYDEVADTARRELRDYYGSDPNS